MLGLLLTTGREWRTLLFGGLQADFGEVLGRVVLEIFLAARAADKYFVTSNLDLLRRVHCPQQLAANGADFLLLRQRPIGSGKRC